MLVFISDDDKDLGRAAVRRAGLEPLRNTWEHSDLLRKTPCNPGGLLHLWVPPGGVVEKHLQEFSAAPRTPFPAQLISTLLANDNVLLPAATESVPHGLRKTWKDPVQVFLQKWGIETPAINPSVT